jgi:hypothetical protein
MPRLISATSIFEGDKNDSASTIYKALNPAKAPRPWTLMPVTPHQQPQTSQVIQATTPLPLVHIPEFVPHQEAVIQVLGDNPTFDPAHLHFTPVRQVPNITPILEKFSVFNDLMEVSPEIALDLANPLLLSTPTHLKGSDSNTNLLQDLACSEDDHSVSNHSTPETEPDTFVILHEAATQTEQYTVPIPDTFLSPDIHQEVVHLPPVPDVLVPSAQVLDNHLLTSWSNIHQYWDRIATHNPKLAADWAIDTESLLKNMANNV